MKSKRVIIAGGTGFIGSALAREFTSRGWSVVVLTRSPRSRSDGIQEVQWDGVSASAWASVLDGADAIVNVTGKTINCPHTAHNLQDILVSRVNSVNAIASAISRAKAPPGAWVQASALGYYGDTGDVIKTEHSASGSGALADICRQWEAALDSASRPQIRKVILRIGLVLGRDGGALPVLAGMTRWYLGGAAGNGRQYLSWVHIADLASMFAAAVDDESLSGTFNAVAPNAVTNATFMRELRRALRRPWSPPVPAFAVKFGARLMGSDGTLALVSQRCAPQRLVAAGFQFRFPQLSRALDDLYA